MHIKQGLEKKISNTPKYQQKYPVDIRIMRVIPKFKWFLIILS